ncbi:MAG: hypothetical protein ABI441_10920 [Flavobacterium sp.]
MKTTIYMLVFIIIGALTLKPIIPKHYPPKKVVEQKQANVLKEIKLENIINRIEYEVKVDSMEIKHIKVK